MAVAAVCPGSFDPITNGHLDVVERAAARFDRVVVAVLENPRKEGLFTVAERLDLIRETTAHLDNVEVESFHGLLVDFCNDRGIGLICKGLRAVSDFEYELQMAQMNQQIGDVETVFLSTRPEWSYLSSSLVKEVARFGGTIDATVPPAVAAAIHDKVAAQTDED
jgi:pantetheine-phosphate adenylyltransferase